MLGDIFVFRFGFSVTKL